MFLFCSGFTFLVSLETFLGETFLLRYYNDL